MNVLIIEDEKLAAEKLTNFLSQYDRKIKVLKIIGSVKEAVSFLNTQMEQVDLLFMDIQLSDGLSFEIFNQVTVNKPVIFITAFNQYAIEAFKVNSIDYLLKPLEYDKLTLSLEKLKGLARHLPDYEQAVSLQVLNQMMGQMQKSYKERFMVKSGDHIRSFTVKQIHLFFADGRNVYMVNEEGHRFILDYKLEELEGLLDPRLFFRVNRSIILHIQAIRDVLLYSNSRLKISLYKAFDKEIIVSREKVSFFKDWFNGVSIG